MLVFNLFYLIVIIEANSGYIIVLGWWQRLNKGIKIFSLKFSKIEINVNFGLYRNSRLRLK